MKIDRRCFISLVIGGAVGSTLSPVPWKLMDDAAIWTQNWSWVPDPDKGPSSYVTSACTLCPGGCGISVRKVADRAVKIDGQEDHPINQGGLCPLGLSGLQYLYGPARVRTPMKRVGKRGEGQWQEISWKEAVAAVSDRLTELRKAGKPQTVACITDSDRGTVPNLIGRFMTAYGSPNFIRSASVFDTLEQAAYLTQGQQGTIGIDFENADYVISFGNGILEGGGAMLRMFRLSADGHKEKTIVQVEPRLSETGTRASRWVPVKAGTEGALALGMAHVIVRQKLYNADFVDNFSFGFEDWGDAQGAVHKGFKTMVLESFSPDKVAEITGVPAKTIISLAREFAGAEKPLAIFGRGKGALPGSMDECLAIHSLNALVGNINKKGGITVVDEIEYADWPEAKIDETAAKGMQQPRIDQAGTDRFPNTRFLLHRFPGIINAAKGESPVQALLVAGGNPLYAIPDTAATKQAFDKIPFIVSFSPYMDETAAYSDYILPNHVYLERFQDLPTPAGLPYQLIGLSKPVVRPLYDTQHVADTFIALAKAQGGFVADAFPWRNYEKFLKETFKKDWKKLNRKGYVVVADNKPEPLALSFGTASGKFEFYPTTRNNPSGKDEDALPYYSPVPLEGGAQQFPVVLIPYDSMRLAETVGSAPFMTKTLDDTVLKKDTGFVEINPETARKLGLKEGDAAILETVCGKAEVYVHFFDGIMPGLLALPRGLGHTAYSEYLAGKGINFNSLIRPIDDPSTGLDMAWGIRARLGKA